MRGTPFLPAVADKVVRIPAGTVRVLMRPLRCVDLFIDGRLVLNGFRLWVEGQMVLGPNGVLDKGTE